MVRCRDLAKSERLFGVWDSQSGQGQKFEGRLKVKTGNGHGFQVRKTECLGSGFQGREK